MTTAPTRGLGLGTTPVFLASVCTILGAIMFLRFGYAVGHVGLLGAVMIILIGHLVTVPTALAIAEIATNRKVEGGGEYYIISRSFGSTIGGTIGIALYLSQAVSVAFYMIALAEAFRPLQGVLETHLGLAFDPRMISVPGALILGVLISYRGAALGVKALWVVAVVLGLSLVSFFFGTPTAAAPAQLPLLSRVEGADPFMLVFAICFPGFTGMTAGVGLSGDLARPSRSIPLGIMLATGVGALVYILLVVKMAASAGSQELASDQLIMSRIALWGPLIPIGLACATLSSAVGSILVAPRTLQALAADHIIPQPALNKTLAAGVGKGNEPRNATLLTTGIAVVTASLGDVDIVARLISMFFMVTYGALCAISFLEHFAARPSYRPSFRSKWYISLIGALACLLLMFQMDFLGAFAALILMTVIYQMIRRLRSGGYDLSTILRGVMTQATRAMQVRLQRDPTVDLMDWRPSIIMVDERTFDRNAPLRFLAWLCQRYGVGTYLHYIPGLLTEDSHQESRKILRRLLRLTVAQYPNVYVDTIISPSMKSALAQSLQVPGVSGVENNTILLEFSRHDPDKVLDDIKEALNLARSVQMNALVLRHGDHFFGHRREIHIWLSWLDYNNASLMILVAYILLGNSDWRGGEISIFAAYPEDDVEKERKRLGEFIQSGRIPVSAHNIQVLSTRSREEFEGLVAKHSAAADLVILGFSSDRLDEEGPQLFLRHPELREVVFVGSQEWIPIE